MSGYDLYSKFDIELHKANYRNYLEVVIAPDGTVMYAVPSHQEKLIAVACQSMGISWDELNASCPREYYFDFMRWLCKIAGYIAVWDGHCEYWELTVHQVGKLRQLKMHGLYEGEIPKTS